MTEKEFQRSVDELAKALGFELRYHTFDSRRSAKGFPDLVLVSTDRARVVLLELKSEIGKLTFEQRFWLEALTLCGLEAYAVWPRDFDAIVKGLQTADWSGLQGAPTKRRAA